MPLYEYQCQECGLRFERRQSFSEEAVKTCPECTGSVVRLIQPAGIIFKGSGFYVTDSRSKSPTAMPGNRKEDNGSSADTSSTEKGDKGSKAGDSETPKSEGSKAKAESKS
jgi:putative FmdB family regulatory protein